MRAFAVLLLISCEQHAPAPTKTPPPAVARKATYCPDAKPWPGGARTCTTDADCPHGRCYPDGVPDYSGMCGEEPRQIEKCTSDHDCPHGWCDHKSEQHGCDEVILSQCRPACTASSCKTGEVCGPTGRCGPAQCTDGYACAAGWTCDPKASITDAHGCGQPPCTATSCGPNLRCAGSACDVKTCSSTADCDCGACMSGRCSPRPGVCGPETPPSPPA